MVYYDYKNNTHINNNSINTPDYTLSEHLYGDNYGTNNVTYNHTNSNIPITTYYNVDGTYSYQTNTNENNPNTIDWSSYQTNTNENNSNTIDWSYYQTNTNENNPNTIDWSSYQTNTNENNPNTIDWSSYQKDDNITKDSNLDDWSIQTDNNVTTYENLDYFYNPEKYNLEATNKNEFNPNKKKKIKQNYLEK